MINRNKKSSILLIMALLLNFLFVNYSFAAYAPSGVHTHSTNISISANKIIADTGAPDPSDKLTSVTINGLLQNDIIIIYKYDYNGNVLGQETYSSLPITISPNSFGVKFSLATGSVDGCRYAYYSEATNNNGYTAYWEPLDPHPSGGETPPPDPEYPTYPEPPTPPTPPPALPAAPVIPETPEYTVSQPTMPGGDITVPGPGTFDGTYIYQEPDRQGAYTYTPPPLDIPDPIPSPPPPPSGPGLFDFSSIMQSLGTVQEQKPVEQPASVSAPITRSEPVSKTTPKAGDTPKTAQSPVVGESPVTRDMPGTVAPANVSTPIGVAPALQPTAPLPVQPGVVQPAVRQEPLSKSTPLVPSDPLTPEPPAGQ